MSLLIGFPNQVFTPNLRLGLYHESGDKLQWIIPDLPWKTSGATGIASNGKWIYVSYQKAGLAVYDFGFQIRQFYEYKFVNDPHSLKFYKDNILVVSSGTNEIYKLFLDDKGFADHEELFWRPADLNKTQKDLIHVNSLSVSKNGEVFITLFGNKNPKGWEKTLCGELVNISSNQVILRGLQNPHTAYCLGNKILFCESLTGKLWDQKGMVCQLGGYLRGITEDETNLIVASSARRKISKSQGIIKERIGEFESHLNSGTYLIYLDKKNFQIKKKKKVSCYGNEIFDLLWIPASKLELEYTLQDAKDLRIQSFEHNLLGLVGKMEGLCQENQEKERLIQLKQKSILEKDYLIKSMEESLSWRITSPLRKIKQRVESFKKNKNK